MYTNPMSTASQREHAERAGTWTAIMTACSHEFEDANTLESIGAPPVTASEVPAAVALRPEQHKARTNRALPKQRIGRYQLRRAVGVDRCSESLLAYDPLLDRELTVKIYRAPRRVNKNGVLHVCERSETRRNIYNRARLVAKLDHPHICRIHDVGESDDRVWIAHAPIRGVNLRTWLSAAPRSWQTLFQIMHEVGSAMAAAHTRGVVHGDLNPDNIFIDDEGHAQLVNFAVSSGLEVHPSAANAVRARGGANQDPARVSPPPCSHDAPATVAAILGQPEYLAPERQIWSGCGGRADQFSYCVVFFEALFGRRPFESYGCDEHAAARTHSVLVPTHSTRRVPGWLATLLIKGLSADPRHRHSSMRHMMTSFMHAHRSWQHQQKALRLLSSLGLVLTLAALAAL